MSEHIGSQTDVSNVNSISSNRALLRRRIDPIDTHVNYSNIVWGPARPKKNHTSKIITVYTRSVCSPLNAPIICVAHRNGRQTSHHTRAQAIQCVSCGSRVLRTNERHNITFSFLTYNDEKTFRQIICASYAEYTQSQSHTIDDARPRVMKLCTR